MDMCNNEIAIIRIDVSAVDTSKEFHSLLKNSLNFPDYYGMNWDAFWDLITKYVEMPNEIILHGWRNMNQKIRVDADAFLQCIVDYNNENPDDQCKVSFT